MRLRELLLAAAIGLVASQRPDAKIRPSEADIRVEYAQLHDYDMKELTGVDFSHKHATVMVIYCPGDDSLRNVHDAIFSKVKRFYGGYGVDLEVIIDDSRPRDSHAVQFYITNSDLFDRNSPVYSYAAAGFADVDRRFAFVHTRHTDTAWNYLPQKTFEDYYSNLIIHELAHLFSLEDLATLDTTCAIDESDNLMDQDNFTSYPSGEKPLFLSSEQEAQMHSYLSCGKVYDLVTVRGHDDFSFRHQTALRLRRLLEQ